MTYAEEIDAALDEDIASLTKRLRSLYAGGERLKPVTSVPRVIMEEDEDDERFSETYQRMQEQKGACAKSGAAYQHHK